ncbi:hypothetical protein [Rosenbergiella epipactidis]|uniref:hypothetical protein n=1 Tax=Rosenbergiella epipactidis TaxID=1544694 RepID=UPI001F4D55C4|nr:hypothetical protein [Rosenbergiella epipactidis]
MSGNGGENAHNNQFGGRDRGPTGGIKGTSAPGGPGNSVTGGWGWSYNPGKGPVTTTLPDGSIAINITGGGVKPGDLQRTMVEIPELHREGAAIT